MSYTKHNFSAGNTLLASQLNEMDDAIAANEIAAADAKTAAEEAKATAEEAKTTAEEAKKSNLIYTDIYKEALTDGVAINIAKNFFAGDNIFILDNIDIDSSSPVVTSTKYEKLYQVTYHTYIDSETNITMLQSITFNDYTSYYLQDKVEFTSDFLNEESSD